MGDEKVIGLTDKQVKDRVDKGLVNYTDNSISKSTKEIVRTHTLTYFNFLNLFLGVLIIFSGRLENLTFLGVIIVNSVIGIAQELKVKQLVDGLSVITATKAKVVRNSKIKEIHLEEIVKDDIIVIETGNQIGADSVVLASSGIEVNESMITGESVPVKKAKGDKLLSGSYLVAGSGVARVEHVGKDNYATVLASQAKDKKRANSEMQDSIKRIIQVISIVIIPVGILLFLSQKSVEGTSLSDAMVSTVAGVIGMIPEGLVLLTSVSFILGIGRLARKRALVQEMEAIEALARVNVLCTDKTGTITTGELEVVDIIKLGGKDIPEVKEIMNEIAFAFDDVNSTQKALMEYFTETRSWVIDDLIPFSSARKFRAIKFKDHGSYILGAPEFIIRNNAELMAKIDPYSQKGLRVLLLGQAGDISSETGKIQGVTPLAFILISDCIRPEARSTFAYFAEQGVDVKVISGDNPATVSQIAVEAGLKDGQHYVDATTLPDDDVDLKEAVREYTVYGRVTPEQKQRIIKAYQEDGKIVGMVGDGVNDVLALKDADCGIAMAAGSDAAKQVAHIVLLDSDFACMKDIVREGRMIISNIERVSALYLTKTIYSVLLSVIFILLGRSYPFIPIHLSLISMVAIGIPSFFLALEQTENVTQSGFLKHVLKISLPGAVAIVICMLLNQILGFVMGFDDTVMSTYNLVVAGCISLMVLLKVSSPLNKRRRFLCNGMIVIFCLGILFLPRLLSINTIFMWRMLFVLPMLAAAYYLMRYLSFFMRHIVK